MGKGDDGRGICAKGRGRIYSGALFRFLDIAPLLHFLLLHLPFFYRSSFLLFLLVLHFLFSFSFSFFSPFLIRFLLLFLLFHHLSFIEVQKHISLLFLSNFTVSAIYENYL